MSQCVMGNLSYSSSSVLVLDPGNCHQDYPNMLWISSFLVAVFTLIFERIFVLLYSLLNKLNSMIFHFTMNDNDDNDTHHCAFCYVVKRKQ